MIFEFQQHNYLFIHIPKNGGTSVMRAIREHFPIRKQLEPEFCPLQKGRCLKRHTDLATCLREERFDYSFCVFRDPLDRLLSEYQWSDQSQAITFGQFVDSIDENCDHLRKQVDFVTDERGQVRIDRIIEFDDLEKQFSEAFKIDISHLNTSEKTGSPVISSETLLKIKNKYREDYALLSLLQEKRDKIERCLAS
jgi:hypothetical protein